MFVIGGLNTTPRIQLERYSCEQNQGIFLQSLQKEVEGAFKALRKAPGEDNVQARAIALLMC